MLGGGRGIATYMRRRPSSSFIRDVEGGEGETALHALRKGRGMALVVFCGSQGKDRREKFLLRCVERGKCLAALVPPTTQTLGGGKRQTFVWPLGPEKGMGNAKPSFHSSTAGERDG